MKKPPYVLSSCGTSLLTNCAMVADKKRIARNSNASNKTEATSGDIAVLENVIRKAHRQLMAADVEEAAGLSAELNGIIRLYGGKLTPKGDFHQLLCTDTWLGEVTSRIIEEWLTKRGFSVNVKRQADLQTQDIELFQSALSDLVKWCEETLPAVKESHWVVFNLTGGFKSVQGFLQTLASFYAHEAVYIFETSQSLLRIPGLPVRMGGSGVLAENLPFFRRLALRLPLSTEPDNLPETMLLRMEGQTALSPWGELIWQKKKKTCTVKRCILLLCPPWRLAPIL